MSIKIFLLRSLFVLLIGVGHSESFAWHPHSNNGLLIRIESSPEKEKAVFDVVVSLLKEGDLSRYNYVDTLDHGGRFFCIESSIYGNHKKVLDKFYRLKVKLNLNGTTVWGDKEYLLIPTSGCSSDSIKKALNKHRNGDVDEPFFETLVRVEEKFIYLSVRREENGAPRIGTNSALLDEDKNFVDYFNGMERVSSENQYGVRESWLKIPISGLKMRKIRWVSDQVGYRLGLKFMADLWKIPGYRD